MSTTRKLLMATTAATGFGGQAVLGSASQSGSVSFTVPAGVTSISVLLVDGGTQGSPGSDGTTAAPGGGGAKGTPGGRRYINNIAVTPGQVISGVIAAPGGVTSFGSFTGWIPAPNAGSATDGSQGQTSDNVQSGGRGGYGGGEASMVDAAAIGVPAASSVVTSPDGTPGANGKWPGGAGGGGGGGAGGRTQQGTGWRGGGAPGGSGTNGGIRIVWPGNLRQYPNENTEDWSMGEAGLWEVVRTSTGIIYSIEYAGALGWYSGSLRSSDGGQTWGSSGQGTSYALRAGSNKIFAQLSASRTYQSLAGGSWGPGFSGAGLGTFSWPLGLETDGAGTWATSGDSSSSIYVSYDDGLTSSRTFSLSGLRPGPIVYLGDDRWIALPRGSGTAIGVSDDGMQTLARHTVSMSLTQQNSSQGAATNMRGTIIACGSAAKIYRSMDNGETWATIATPGSMIMYAVACNPITGVWVMVGADGALLRSDDDGMSWQSIPGVTTSTLWAVATDRAGTWMACGANGTIIRSTV